jgi:hypothetical protein
MNVKTAPNYPDALRFAADPFDESRDARRA